MPVSLPCTVIWDLDGCQQNFGYLGAVVYGTAAGPGAVTFSGTSSAQVVVKHDLGNPPSHVGITVNQGTAGFTVAWDQATDTTFRATITTSSGTFTGTVPFTWVAFV